ncbi:hypothetical protein [Sphingorhabdus sp. 109]|jgi:hypothetical protein|uniref:hypothetical protein n=1 Tax=Sphingorhabdus sp. 109 TaxID=2653173 RepID=UPI0012F187D1|nr:hypothetical protein [Sphingorhabdus sp. 109]VWX60994.1 conserved exported hypothetical protein [Sphingorhabdus sp. 109]
MISAATSAVAFAMALTVTAPMNAQPDLVGNYLCTIVEKASIATTHLEGAPPPKAFIDDQLPTRFGLRITSDDENPATYKMAEIRYQGPDLDPIEWHTENSVLHSVYVGDGVTFKASDSEAFVTFHATVHSNEDGDFSFHHAGFEWAGGEDGHLSIRWGRCKKLQ